MGEGVVVAGSGFAGFWAAVAARRVLGDRASVTLVSREPTLVIRPRLYEADPATFGVDIAPHLAAIGVSFVPGDVRGLDVAARRLVLADGTSVAYERLIVATGSVMPTPNIAGADGAFSIDSLADAVRFDDRLREVAAGGQPVSIAVVGAGFTGIELALELRDRIAGHGNAEAAEQSSIVLIDRADVVGPELGEGPRDVIEAALREAGVELRLGANVRRIGPMEIEFGGDSVVRADAVVLTTGMVAAPFTASVPGDRDGSGRIVVDAHLRAPAAPDVFVTGDAAHADTGDGHIALQSCQHALQLGRFAGENAARDLVGLPLVAYRHPSYVTCLDLGRSGAVLTQGWDRQVRMTGADAKRLKININGTLIYPPAADDPDALLAASQLPE